MVENYQLINLVLNCKSEHGQIFFNLINTINIDLIQKIVKKFPIRYQDHHQQHQNNVYDFVWSHHRLIDPQKKNLLQLMHKRHLSMSDFYRQNEILYNSCARYLPQAPRRHSPKKEIIYNPNLKIISGEIIKGKQIAMLNFKSVIMFALKRKVKLFMRCSKKLKLKLILVAKQREPKQFRSLKTTKNQKKTYQQKEMISLFAHQLTALFEKKKIQKMKGQNKKDQKNDKRFVNCFVRFFTSQERSIHLQFLKTWRFKFSNFINCKIMQRQSNFVISSPSGLKLKSHKFNRPLQILTISLL